MAAQAVEVGEGEGGEQPVEERKSDEAEAEDAERLSRAMEAKARGTDLYKEQKFVEARKEWLTALAELPGKDNNLARLATSLHLNLSQVALQLKEYKEVITQATMAIEMDNQSSKAYFRRGLAAEALGRLEDALKDLRQAAKLEPRNAEIRKKFEDCRTRHKEAEEAGEAMNPPPEHDVATLPRAFLDVAVGSAPARRLEFALYTDTAPRTAENFRMLCLGEHPGTTARGKAFQYKGSILHRLIPGFMIQGGDFENANGTGGESIYGRRFDDEILVDKHTRRGLLAMANNGPNTNGSNFYVTLGEAQEHLDKHHVIFGELVNGLELLDELEKLETDPECRPLVDCKIVDCGVP